MPRFTFPVFIIVLSGALVLSFTGLIMRQIETADAWQVLFFRSLGCVATLSLILLFKRNNSGVSFYRTLNIYSFIAAIFIGLSFGMNVYALTIITVAQAYFILSTFPLLTAFLAWVFLKERVNLITWVTIIVVLIGVVVMVLEDAAAPDNNYGMFIALLSPFLFAIALVLVRSRKQIDTLSITWLAGFVSLALAMSLMGTLKNIDILDAVWGCLMGVTLGFGVGCYLTSAKYIPAAHVALLSLLETALAPVWAWLGVGEKPTSMILIGGSLIFLAVTVRAVIEIFPQQDNQKLKS